MSFRINTNITALEAQEYLRQTSDTQGKTIGRVTSGLRILSSGDDAAGLAIANSFRSDQSVLTQGIRNANDGLSTLQTIDGGINNISKLLDRARTLATQSASGTFNGNRAVLNAEFQSVVAEIDRQAQSIGLNAGGQFAKSLSVFIGGGKSSGGISEIINGSTNVDLTSSTVDAQSLGLKGTQASGVITTDIGTGSPATSVEAIVRDPANVASLAVSGSSELLFHGPGFAGKNLVKVFVNLSGVSNIDNLVASVNYGIENSGNSATASATAFKNAGIRAVTLTDTTGKKAIGFVSSTAAFQVEAGDLVANGLLGNVTSASNPTGLSLKNSVLGGTNSAAPGTTFAGTGTIIVRVQGAGLASPPVDISLDVTAATTVDQAIASLQSAISKDSDLQSSGIALEPPIAGTALKFSNSRGQRFEVLASGDLNNLLGLGSFRSSAGATGTFDYSSLVGSGAAFTVATNETLEFSLGGGPSLSLTIQTATATAQGAADALNAQIATSASLVKAGIVADVSGGEIRLRSLTGTNFRVNTVGNSSIFGLNSAAATGVVHTANTNPDNNTAISAFTSGGIQQSGAIAFQPILIGGDGQTVTLSVNDPSGITKTVSLILKNDSTLRNAGSVDEAISSLNDALLQSNDESLKKIVAIKEKSGFAGADQINFVSVVSSFRVQIGTNASGRGLGNQGTVLASVSFGEGSTSDISSQNGAENAVSALADAVVSLGNAQAAVGKGQNQFSFAINLASSQLTNIAAAESRLRDADLAAEAATLSKTQILLQAGISALAQANSAPQQVLSLLRQ